MSDPDLPDHVLENRRHWDLTAADWVRSGERGFGAAEPTWGCWGLPESELELLPRTMAGMDAIELGCGTAYVSAWMARRGARVVAVDNSEQQLKTARRLAREHGIEMTFLHGNAEELPYADHSFDFAISEYGAAIWCDPWVWIREAHRILRPDGRLVFLGNTPLSMICTPLSGEPCETRLHRPYFGLGRFDWRDLKIDPGGVEFNLTMSEWLRTRRMGTEMAGGARLEASPALSGGSGSGLRIAGLGAPRTRAPLL